MTAPSIGIAGLVDLLAPRIGLPDRTIVAIAGAPGSGKSTLAEDLAHRLNAHRRNSAEVVPMDGFHYDDLYLVPAGLRPRKGAPDTFDVGGLLHALRRLRARDEPAVAIPVFDRSIEIARAGARLLGAEVPIVIVEGNYLLVDAAPWAALAPVFDIRVLLEVGETTLRRRLESRWRRQKLEPREIVARLEDNDLPNGRYVMAQSRGEDYRLAN